MFDISTNLPSWFILLALVVGIVYAVFLYQKEDKIEKEWLKNLLFLIRACFVSFLCFLLLGPILNLYIQQKEKPILIIVQDASSSLQEQNNFDILNGLHQKAANEFQVFPFHFSDHLKEGLVKENKGLKTNYAAVFDEVESKFTGRNVAALVLATDGLYNMGENPTYKSNTTTIPIFPIAFGDTLQQQDLLIKNVQYNEVAFLGNDFPVEVLIAAHFCKNKVVELKLIDDDQLLHKEKLTLRTANFHQKISFKIYAKQKGLKKYKLELSSLEGEKNKLNNTYEIFVDVLDSKHNILLLSNNTHPDIAAFKSVLSKHKHYNIESYKIDKFDGNIEKYNLIVLFGKAYNSEIMQKIKSSKVPLLFFVGAKTNINQFNTLQDALSINVKNSLQEVNAAENEHFSLFTISTALSNLLPKLPPIHTYFGNYQLTANSEVFLNQKIGKIVTKKPILFFQNSTNKKVGVFVGEGFWKWKLMEFSEQKQNNCFDELFLKTTQFLLLNDDKSKFRLKYKHKINANSPIIFEAELYNESYELVTKDDISLSIFDEKGKEYAFVFSKHNNSYQLNVSSFAVGDYTFEAQVYEKNLIRKGNFSVIPFQLEMLQTKANHQLLYNLAYQSGGALFYPDKIDLLYNKVKNSDRNQTIIHKKEKLQEMINIPWILFTLLILICTEWFIRRFNGLH